MDFLRKLYSTCTKFEALPDQEEPNIELEPHLDAIREQMEFYLSDSNIEFDAFMKGAISEREDRFVPIETFLTFNRMKALKATNEDVIAACSASRTLEVNKELNMVRSKEPFVSDPRRSFRTIHIEGFDQNETLDDIKALFKEQYPNKVCRIEMRKNNRKGGEQYFSGNVNIELKDEMTAKQIVKNGIMYHGNTMKCILFSEFRANLKAKKAAAEKKETPKKGTHKDEKQKKN